MNFADTDRHRLLNTMTVCLLSGRGHKYSTAALFVHPVVVALMLLRRCSTTNGMAVGGGVLVLGAGFRSTPFFEFLKLVPKCKDIFKERICKFKYVFSIFGRNPDCYIVCSFIA